MSSHDYLAALLLAKTVQNVLLSHVTDVSLGSGQDGLLVVNDDLVVEIVFELVEGAVLVKRLEEAALPCLDVVNLLVESLELQELG